MLKYFNGYYLKKHICQFVSCPLFGFFNEYCFSAMTSISKSSVANLSFREKAPNFAQ